MYIKVILQSGDDHERKYDREEVEGGSDKEESERRGETSYSDWDQRCTKVRLCECRKEPMLLRQRSTNRII
jgi:hypothetical protein